jgi:hypothetical protein
MYSDRDIRNAGATHIESDRSRGCEDRAANGAGEIIVLLGRLGALLNQRLSQLGGSRVCLRQGGWERQSREYRYRGSFRAEIPT